MDLECPYHPFSLLPSGFFVVKFYPVFLVSQGQPHLLLTLFTLHFPTLLFLFPLILCSSLFIYFLWHALYSFTWKTCIYYLFLSSLGCKSLEESSLYLYLHLSKHLAQGLACKWVLNKHLLHWIIQNLLMRCLFLTEKTEIGSLWDVIIRV